MTEKLKRRSSRRIAKKRIWTRHRSRRYERGCDRRFSDYWAGEIGYGTVPVPGRLLAASKTRQPS